MPAKGSTVPDRMNLLLVDDEEGFVRVLEKRLGKRGYEVTSVLNGSEALRALRCRDFDAAVLDLKMEDMDGIEVLRIFRKMVPEMPVIMLTGHGSEEAARQGVAQGAFDYLLKPCEFHELLEKISSAIKGGCST